MAKIHTITDIARNLDTIINKQLGALTILVEGEVSNLRFHASNHIYFNLKDDQSSIACFINKATRIDRSFLENGKTICARVKINYNKQRNESQLLIQELALTGEGILHQTYLKLKEAFSKLGYFDIKHKKLIPQYPTRIGIITAAPSAALKDALITIKNKCPIVDVRVYPTLVQGKNAPSNIIEQLKLADAQKHDTLLLIRGGGSLEDLWCFNDKDLCLTIFNLNTPIISGIGHEIDTTLADFVVDLRCATPTAAAEASVYPYIEVKNKIIDFNTQLIKKMDVIQTQYQNRLVSINTHPLIINPKLILEKNILKLNNYIQQINHFKNNTIIIKKELQNINVLLNGNIKKHIQLNKLNIDNQLYKIINQTKNKYTSSISEFEKLQSLLNAYSFNNTLKRGYSLIQKHNQLISSIHNVEINDELEVVLHDGKLKVKVSDKYE